MSYYKSSGYGSRGGYRGGSSSGYRGGGGGGSGNGDSSWRGGGRGGSSSFSSQRAVGGSSSGGGGGSSRYYGSSPPSSSYESRSRSSYVGGGSSSDRYSSRRDESYNRYQEMSSYGSRDYGRGGSPEPPRKRVREGSPYMGLDRLLPPHSLDVGGAKLSVHPRDTPEEERFYNRENAFPRVASVEKNTSQVFNNVYSLGANSSHFGLSSLNNPRNVTSNASASEQLFLSSDSFRVNNPLNKMKELILLPQTVYPQVSSASVHKNEDLFERRKGSQSNFLKDDRYRQTSDGKYTDFLAKPLSIERKLKSNEPFDEKIFYTNTAQTNTSNLGEVFRKNFRQSENEYLRSSANEKNKFGCAETSMVSLNQRFSNISALQSESYKVQKYREIELGKEHSSLSRMCAEKESQNRKFESLEKEYDKFMEETNTFCNVEKKNFDELNYPGPNIFKDNNPKLLITKDYVKTAGPDVFYRRGGNDIKSNLPKIENQNISKEVKIHGGTTNNENNSVRRIRDRKKRRESEKRRRKIRTLKLHAERLNKNKDDPDCQFSDNIMDDKFKVVKGKDVEDKNTSKENKFVKVEEKTAINKADGEHHVEDNRSEEGILCSPVKIDNKETNSQQVSKINNNQTAGKINKEANFSEDFTSCPNHRGLKFISFDKDLNALPEENKSNISATAPTETNGVDNKHEIKIVQQTGDLITENLSVHDKSLENLGSGENIIVVNLDEGLETNQTLEKEKVKKAPEGNETGENKPEPQPSDQLQEKTLSQEESVGNRTEQNETAKMKDEHKETGTENAEESNAGITDSECSLDKSHGIMESTLQLKDSASISSSKCVDKEQEDISTPGENNLCIQRKTEISLSKENKSTGVKENPLSITNKNELKLPESEDKNASFKHQIKMPRLTRSQRRKLAKLRRLNQNSVINSSQPTKNTITIGIKGKLDSVEHRNLGNNEIDHTARPCTNKDKTVPKADSQLNQDGSNRNIHQEGHNIGQVKQSSNLQNSKEQSIKTEVIQSSANVTKEPISVLVRDENQPLGKIVGEKVKIFEESLLDLLVTALDRPNAKELAINSAGLVKGNYKIECQDEYSYRWLQTAIDKLQTLWEGANIKLVRYVNYKLWRTTVNIPDRDLSLFDVMAKLNWHNRLLNTTKWYLYHHDMKGQYQYFVLGIDSESLDELERLGFQPYYGNERVRFSTPKEYAKGGRSGSDFIRWYSSTKRIYSA